MYLCVVYNIDYKTKVPSKYLLFFFKTYIQIKGEAQTPITNCMVLYKNGNIFNASNVDRLKSSISIYLIGTFLINLRTKY